MGPINVLQFEDETLERCGLQNTDRHTMPFLVSRPTPLVWSCHPPYLLLSARQMCYIQAAGTHAYYVTWVKQQVPE